MTNSRLLPFLESILGKGIKRSGENYAFYCPFNTHSKPKLEINFNTTKSGENQWHCWVCDRKGRKLHNLLKKMNVGQSKIKKLYSILDVVPTISSKQNNYELAVSLPEEYKPLWVYDKNPEFKNAIQYLINRGLTKNDILKYRIGYCSSGPYNGKVIIPSYDANGNLNFFSGRSYYEGEFKHKNPTVSKDIVGFELFVNWSLPLVLCEGAFDAISIKRNAIPLFGKIVLDELKKRIIQNKVRELYIALDRDAIKKAIELVEYFMSNGIEVHLIEMSDLDPSELGFEKMTNLIKDSTPMTFSKLMEYKLSI